MTKAVCERTRRRLTVPLVAMVFAVEVCVATTAEGWTLAGERVVLSGEPPEHLQGRRMNWGEGGAPFMQGNRIVARTPRGGYFHVEDVNVTSRDTWLLTELNGRRGWVKRSDVHMPVNSRNFRSYSTVGDGWVRRGEYGKAFIWYCLAAESAERSKNHASTIEMADRAILARSLAAPDGPIRKQQKLFGLPYQYRGRAHRDSGAIAAAAADFDSQLTYNWRRKWGYLDRGFMRRRLGDSARAEADYKTALLLDPEFGLAYRNLGHLSRKQGDIVAAIEWFKRATIFEPNNAHNHRWLGHCYLYVGLPGDATKSFQQAVTMDPSLTGDVWESLKVALHAAKGSSPRSNHRFARVHGRTSGGDLISVGPLFERPDFESPYYTSPAAVRAGGGVDMSKVFTKDIVYKIEERKNGWAKLSCAGAVGWMPERFLVFDQQGSIPRDDLQRTGDLLVSVS